MSTSNAGQSTAGKTLGGLIVLLIVIVGFAGIGYSVGGVTGAIWVTLIGLVLYGLLYAWPSLTSGAEQTGMAKIVSAPSRWSPASSCSSQPSLLVSSAA
jgi:hypothetical protein